MKALSAASMAFTARVTYATAGRAYRDTIRRANAIRPRLGARDRAVLEAVLGLTTSYSKLMDFTTAREVARIAYGIDDADEIDGRDRERVRARLKKLAKLGLIEITPSGRGRGARLIVSVHAPDETPPAVGGDAVSDSGTFPERFARTPPSGGAKHPPAARHT